MNRLGGGPFARVVATAFLLSSGPLLAAEQIVRPEPAVLTRTPSTAVAIDVHYQTASPQDATLTGLGLRIHFDSTKLDYSGLSNVLAKNLLAQQGPVSDIQDFDNDPTTDRYLLVSWADFGGSWPGSEPQRLLTVSLTTAGNFGGSTAVRFSAASTAAGYTLSGTPAVVTSPSPLVPVVLAVGGVGGSYYTTELTLTNRSATEALLTYTYTASMGGGSGTATDRVSAGRQKVVRDAITYLRNLGVPIPATDSRLGTLSVAVSGAPAAQVSVTGRTTTVVPEGRAGLAYSAVRGSALFNGASWVCGLRSNASDRSNLAVVNAGSTAEGNVRLRITVRSGKTTAPGSGSFDTDPIPPGGWQQWPLDQLLAASNLTLSSPNVFVRLERIAGSAPYTAYGVVNDAGTSDGSFLLPLADASLDGRSGLTLPVLVETSAFTSELSVTNTSGVRKTLQLVFVASAVTAAGGAAIDTLTLEPGEQQIIPGFVGYLRSRGVAGIGPAGPTFAGALFATVSGGDVGGIVLGARTSTPGSVTGRYGLFYGAVPAGTEATSAAWLWALQQNTENRSNLAFVHAGSAGSGAIRLRVDIYDGETGQLVKSVEGAETTLQPRAWTQLDRVLEKYAPGVANAYVRVSRVSGTSPFVAYAVINDGSGPGQRSGDGAYVPMSAEGSDE